MLGFAGLLRGLNASFRRFYHECLAIILQMSRNVNSLTHGLKSSHKRGHCLTPLPLAVAMPVPVSKEASSHADNSRVPASGSAEFSHGKLDIGQSSIVGALTLALELAQGAE